MKTKKQIVKEAIEALSRVDEATLPDHMPALPTSIGGWKLMPTGAVLEVIEIRGEVNE